MSGRNLNTYGDARRSKRIHGEKLPENFDEIYPELPRNPRKTRQENQEGVEEGISVIHSLFRTPGGSRHSEERFASCKTKKSTKSKASIASSCRRRLMEAELKAEEEKARLADEKAQRLDEKAEREKLLIEKRLAIEKEKIAEEIDDDQSQDLSDGENNFVEEAEGVHADTPNLHGTTNPERKVTEWINGQQGMKEDTPIDQLTKVLSNVFEKLATNSSCTGDGMQKFLARQSISKDLPIFNGNPTEWPNFIARFRNSTEAGSYSNSENMDRLLKCLKGKALEAVQCMMFTPENLNQVIETLEVNFGRPKMIINSLQSKAMNLANLDEKKPEMLIDFSNAINNLVSTIESLNCKRYLSNPSLLDQLVEKLPPNLKLMWGGYVQTLTEEENLKDLATWLKPLAKAASFVTTPQPFSDWKKNEPQKGNFVQPRKDKIHVITQSEKCDEKLCVLCVKNHVLSTCRDFKKENIHGRWKIVIDKKVCYGCLKPGHRIEDCPDKKGCEIDGCDKFHHHLLHKKPRRQNVVKIEESASVSHIAHTENSILLKVIPVTLRNNGKEVSTYAFLDDGSTITLMEEWIAKKLNLTGIPHCLHLKGATNMSTQIKKSYLVNFDVIGTEKNKSFSLQNVKTVEKLDLPIQTINGKKLSEKWNHLKNIPAVYLRNVKPTILIGQDHPHLINPLEIIEGPPNGPCASRTRLGWTIHGNSSHLSGRVDAHINHLCHDDELHRLAKESFSTESFGVKVCNKPLRSKQDERCLNIVNKYSKRVADRWETALLWKEDVVNLPESKSMAFRRLRCMEKKMDADPNFAKLYLEKIVEYEQKGYARKLSRDEAAVENGKTWYLPHFGVFNPNKPGKLRFVFDAAAKSHGSSLNDHLLQGPDNLCSLIAVLFKFRQKRIGFTADIKEMFHQINIRGEDLAAQRFLWRGRDRTRTPDSYVVPVMTFGATCSPCLAQEIKNRNALEFQEQYPDAVKAITTRHYVDDYLDSAHDEESAIKIMQEVIHIHKLGGFEIRNWTCSSKAVLQQISQDLRCIEDKDLNLESDMPTERVLGLQWNPNSDLFFFQCKFNKVSSDIASGKKRPTKREVLRLVMSMYDPLGFLAHYTVKAKILMQDIWRTGLGWDDEISDSIYDKWIVWISELQNVKEMKIPRCYCLNMENAQEIQLHTFCDSSEKAFAAVSYLRVKTNENITVTFVMSKTRVAPLKPMSIPRLELQAAVMATRLAETLKTGHEIEINAYYYWSDSKTVLSWIKSDARQYKPFVAVRIGEILETTDVSQWSWIPTDENVSDEATRNSKLSDFSEKSRWLNGPGFLKLPEIEWPKYSFGNEASEDIELKAEFVNAISEFTHIVPNYANVRSWMKLVRSTAWMLRFVNNCIAKIKNTGKMSNSELIPFEYAISEKLLWKQSQLESYGSEIELLKSGKKLQKSSSLLKLSPFLDKDGLLRVNGRLCKSPAVESDVKFPVILNGKHGITKLIVSHFHTLARHHGQELICNELRQRFWISGLRSAVKKSFHECCICKIRRAKPQIPEMGSLPEIRVTRQARPFVITGVDYMGPLTVTIGRRHEKRWIVLFTCMSTRAIHLEIAASLSTDSAIMAIRRFIARRGYPEKIFSDNGTNFHGANNELKKSLLDLKQTEIISNLASKGIEWIFNPPAAPNFGGAFESLVKSVKVSLRECLKERFPREETLHTLLLETEHIVNSRPLTHVSMDPDDPEALTPNHFLLGSSSGMLLPGKFDDTDLCSRKQWRQAQILADKFWQRWIREYLPTLTKRTKWHLKKDPVKVGDLVIIADGNLERSHWPRGMVVKVYPGKDGQVRVADVKTPTGTFRRPASKLCVLDILKTMVKEPLVLHEEEDGSEEIHA